MSTIALSLSFYTTPPPTLSQFVADLADLFPSGAEDKEQDEGTVVLTTVNSCCRTHPDPITTTGMKGLAETAKCLAPSGEVTVSSIDPHYSSPDRGQQVCGRVHGPHARFLPGIRVQEEVRYLAVTVTVYRFVSVSATTSSKLRRAVCT